MTTKYWIGVDKPDVEHHVYKEAHWSEVPPPVANNYEPISWYEQDNAPESPLEADLDKQGESNE